MLFIILFLHQTTTTLPLSTSHTTLFIILFLHQTTTYICASASSKGCLSSCSYIKPQRRLASPAEASVVYHLVPTSNHNAGYVPLLLCLVVYHLVPTSNHNLPDLHGWRFELFIILFLHQTTTLSFFSLRREGCLSSCSYIKPQRLLGL